VLIPCHLARTIGLGLPVEQLGIDAVAHNQPINTVLAGASALVTSDAQHGQLADDVRNVIAPSRGITDAHADIA
jgi:hypothetical protein